MDAARRPVGRRTVHRASSRRWRCTTSFAATAPTVDNTGQELDAQARVIAEQTARSVQAVDVVLRHLAEQFRVGTLSALSAAGPARLPAGASRRPRADRWPGGVPRFGGTCAAARSMSRRRAQPLNVSARRHLPGAARRPRARPLHRRRGAEPRGPPMDLSDRRAAWNLRRANSPASSPRVAASTTFSSSIATSGWTRERSVTLMQQRHACWRGIRRSKRRSASAFRCSTRCSVCARPARTGPTRDVSPVDGVERFGALAAGAGLSAGRHRDARHRRGARAVARAGASAPRSARSRSARSPRCCSRW